ncbi:hypothetical protein GCM10008986_18060 [Salinibacillus aidingensis]|uniref:VOC domain-containing protein n=1 Tax=Salinibacillus aidingensis TaxID=237684 RepID=A0ABN1B803_9BACI
MNFQEFGFILFVENYDECVSFYRDQLQLEVRTVKDSLVIFNLPQGYLMVEQGGVSANQEKTREQNPAVIRFNVDNLKETVLQLEGKGVPFSNRELSFDWGTIAVFHDPDGHRLELFEVH